MELSNYQVGKSMVFPAPSYLPLSQCAFLSMFEKPSPLFIKLANVIFVNGFKQTVGLRGFCCCCCCLQFPFLTEAVKERNNCRTHTAWQVHFSSLVRGAVLLCRESDTDLEKRCAFSRIEAGIQVRSQLAPGFMFFPPALLVHRHKGG